MAQHWEAAREQARKFRELDWNERDVLALIYVAIAVDEGCSVDDVSLWRVRYRLLDERRLWEELSRILPGPLPEDYMSVEEGLTELRKSRLAEVSDDHGEFTGPAPVEGRMWRRWAALQAPHGVPHEDTLASDEIEAFGRDGYVPSGKTIFEHALGTVSRIVDRLLLLTSGALPVGATVRVTGGVHAERSGSVRGVVWTADDERRVCAEPPASFEITFDDGRGRGHIAPADLELLPDWDRDFVVVREGEPLPTRWQACVFLAASSCESGWREQAIEQLRRGWREIGRLVVLVPHPLADADATGAEEWLTQALAWADEILAPLPQQPDAPPELAPSRAADARDEGGRLILFGDYQAPAAEASWARRHEIPAVPGVGDAVTTALKRIGRGADRVGGKRHVPLLIAKSSAYMDWSMRLILMGAVLVSANIEWTYRDEATTDRALRWALRARLRRADQTVAEELITAHAGVLSVVAFHRKQPWTDSEVVLVRGQEEAADATSAIRPHAEERALRLPAITHDLGTGGNTRRAWPFVSEEMGMLVDPDRLLTFGARNESSLMAASNRLVTLKLTSDEIEKVRNQTFDEGDMRGLEVHRVADLLAQRWCDWATLGLITRAVLPTDPPASGDFRLDCP